jgi:hypothetical protein
MSTAFLLMPCIQFSTTPLLGDSLADSFGAGRADRRSFPDLAVIGFDCL